VDLDVLLGKLLTAEQRLPKANEPAAPRAYAGAAERAPRGGGQRPPPRCFYCEELGHIVRNCRKARADRARGAKIRQLAIMGAAWPWQPSSTWRRAAGCWTPERRTTSPTTHPLCRTCARLLFTFTFCNSLCKSRSVAFERQRLLSTSTARPLEPPPPFARYTPTTHVASVFGRS